MAVVVVIVVCFCSFVAVVVLFVATAHVWPVLDSVRFSPLPLSRFR